MAAAESERPQIVRKAIQIQQAGTVDDDRNVGVDLIARRFPNDIRIRAARVVADGQRGRRAGDGLPERLAQLQDPLVDDHRTAVSVAAGTRQNQRASLPLRETTDTRNHAAVGKGAAEDIDVHIAI